MNTQHELTAMLRQAVYSRLAGYEDTNDAERLAVDPAISTFGLLALARHYHIYPHILGKSNSPHI
jgi:hypothetical protein